MQIILPINPLLHEMSENRGKCLLGLGLAFTISESEVFKWFLHNKVKQRKAANPPNGEVENKAIFGTFA